ncbi:MAG: DUF3822 family protein [Chlorobi bacterium]|nr:DUF3822 family protein [Chlorobiota bacterium]
MKNFFVFNEGFSKSKTASYILSLQLDDFSYSYVILDPINKVYDAINHHNFEKKVINKHIVEKAEVMIKEDLFLSKNYKTVYFNYSTNKSTLVPAELFDRKKIKQIFTFTHKLEEFEELHFNYIKEVDSYNIFAMPSDLTTLLVNKFPEIVFVHQNNIFIKTLVEKGKAVKFKLPVVHVNVNSNFFDIGIYMDDKFVMVNSYRYNDKNDFIYYLLNTLEQYKIKVNKMHFNVSGILEKDTDFYNFVLKFIPKLNFLSLQNKMKFNFKDIDQHLIFNLLNLHNADN